MLPGVTPVVYINGAFVPETEALIRVDDGGWLHGAGLFETMRAENGRVFRFDAHVRRLIRSAERVLRPIERSMLPTEGAIGELLERNRLHTARVRMTATAGSVRGDPSATEFPPLSVCVSALPLTAYPTESYERGVQAVICDYRVSPSDPVAGHKTTSYLPRLLGLRRAQMVGAAEAIWFTTQNHLAEGCISNVFVVSDGVLRTAPLETPVLAGIARAVVFELARANGIKAREEVLTINDLLDAQEVLLTNSIMQVMPVVRVEKRDIGDGHVGPMAKRLLLHYRELVQKESDLQPHGPVEN